MPYSQNSKRTEKLQIMINENELTAIDDWRFDNGLPSRAAAIRELLRRGLLSVRGFQNTVSDNPKSGEFGVLTVNKKEN